MIMEMCIESVESAIASAVGGADRVELCANLLEGGTTPSLGAVRETRRRAAVALSVMVRPRGGDFCYSEEEFAVMREDVQCLRDEKVDCIVFGLLLPDGRVDRERTRELMELARPCEVTFHRAFDMTRDPYEALDVLVDLGVDRVLTSGQEDSVLEGIDLLRDLVRAAGRRIIVMPGCGVTLKNAARVASETGAGEIHVASVAGVASRMIHRNPSVFMGTALRSAEYERWVTSAEAVRQLRAALG